MVKVPKIKTPHQSGDLGPIGKNRRTNLRLPLPYTGNINRILDILIGHGAIEDIKVKLKAIPDPLLLL